MAAISASNECVLLTNGKTAAVINLRSSGEIQVLELPKAVNVSRTKPQVQLVHQEQRKVFKQQERKNDGDKCEVKEDVVTEQGSERGHVITEQGSEQGHVITEQGSEKGHVITEQGSEKGHVITEQGGEKGHVITEQGGEKESEDRSENRILACTLSPDGQVMALCDDRKFLHVYQVHDGRYCLQFSSLVAHRCTSVTLTRNNQHVIVADKSGDVYVFHVQDQVTRHVSRAENEGSVGELVSGIQTASLGGQNGDNPGGGSLLLGHHSMLLDLLIVDSDRLIVTCDRDEKIRISHYPDAYNIQAFCLGHTKFVVSLAYDESRKVLISGSGDATVRLWAVNGQELHRRNVLPDMPAAQTTTLPSRAEENMAAPESGETEENMAAPESGETEDGRQKPQMTIQQICFSSECQTLFVALYKSPHILAYRLSEAETGGHLTLQLISALGRGQENVASMCVSRSALWVLRQGGSRLEVTAYRIQCQEDMVQLVQVTEEAGSVSMALKAFSDQAELLTVATNSLDLMPSLWKPSYQEDVRLKTNPKRLSGDVESGKQRKRHKR